MPINHLSGKSLLKPATGTGRHTPSPSTQAIELDPDRPTGYGHRAIAYTQLPTPE